MTKNLFQISIIFLLCASFSAQNFGQALVCKKSALDALRPIPKLEYQCDEDLTESDDAVLSQTNRREALNLYTETLEKLTASDWWQTSVEDLNLCDFNKQAGALSIEQKDDYENGNYFYALRGNNQFRVIVAPDPCYQTGFNGANVFLLNRVGGRVFAAEIIDGFYTRADFPLGFDYALNGRETIIEIATTSGGLYPTETYYYFTIDPKTNRAVPKKLFKEKDKLTNQIYSNMILGEPEEYGLPPKSEALQIIRNGQLAKSFYVFDDTGKKFGDNTKFVRVRYKWNGKFYD